MAGQCLQALKSGDVPDLDRTVIGAAEEATPIDGQCPHRIRVPCQGFDPLQGVQVPHLLTGNEGLGGGPHCRVSL